MLMLINGFAENQATQVMESTGNVMGQKKGVQLREHLAVHALHWTVGPRVRLANAVKAHFEGGAVLRTLSVWIPVSLKRM